jgi:hypothetical protein
MKELGVTMGLSIRIFIIDCQKKCTINDSANGGMGGGTESIKNICQKKNVFLIMLSEFSIAIKYDQILRYCKFSTILPVYSNILRFLNNASMGVETHNSAFYADTSNYCYTRWHIYILKHHCLNPDH